VLGLRPRAAAESIRRRRRRRIPPAPARLLPLRQISCAFELASHLPLCPGDHYRNLTITPCQKIKTMTLAEQERRD